jgi:aminopeptidase-like protein
MYNLLKKLYPICRSITGNGVRETLNIIKKYIPINIYDEDKTGKKIFDWEIPKEWNITEAYIEDEDGNKIVDYANNNLHIMSYSIPINTIISYDELKDHLFYIESQLDTIPYLTTYYKEFWGFCLTYKQFLSLDKNKKYHVVINSNLSDGSLTYGDLIIPGNNSKEFIFSCYICHPSMCNDSLSGVVVATELVKYIISLNGNHYYTYRFVFIPETIGAINYIYKNITDLKQNVIGGLVLTCCGDEGEFTYIKTLNDNSYINKIIFKLFQDNNLPLKIREFYTCGSDERQYNYPGIDLDVGSLIKTKYGEFKEYHTGDDNFTLVTEKGLLETYSMYLQVINILENNFIYKNVNLCEPKLGKYSLYSNIGGLTKKLNFHNYRLIGYYINSSRDIIDISEKLNMNFEDIIYYINILKEKNIIKLVS